MYERLNDVWSVIMEYMLYISTYTVICSYITRSISLVIKIFIDNKVVRKVNRKSIFSQLSQKGVIALIIIDF